MEKVTLRVPASSANLGPGFDSIGCALTIYNELTFEKSDNELEITGCEPQFCTKENLAYTSYLTACSEWGLPSFNLLINVKADIPMARGLGSSTAMTVAGIAAAAALCDKSVAKEEIARVATIIEGHPDNIAPAVYGGLTASYIGNGVPHTVNFDMHEKWHFTALIPDFELSTKKAREALPQSVTLKDAVFNISRAAVMLRALETGDEKILHAAVDDRLHQQYRKPLIDEYDKVEALARELGAVAFYLSGAGPTLMCITADKTFTGKISARLEKGFNNKWRAVPLNIDREGVTAV